MCPRACLQNLSFSFFSFCILYFVFDIKFILIEGKPQCARVHVCNTFPTQFQPGHGPPTQLTSKMLANKIDIDSSGCCRNTLQRNPKNFPVLMDGTYSGYIITIFEGSIKCVQQIMSTLNLFVATINCRIIKLQLLIANELFVLNNVAKA